MTQALVHPDPIAAVIPLVTDSVQSPHTRRAYARAIQEYLHWHRQGDWPRLSRASVLAYRTHLAATVGNASSNLALCALRCLAREAAANGYLDDATALGIQAVRGTGWKGTRTGNWLTRRDAQRLLDAPDPETLVGLRDRLLLGLLLGCGLRRDEAARLVIEQMQEREGRRLLVDVLGKGSKLRPVVLPHWCAEAADAWLAACGATAGPLLRPVTPTGQVEDRPLSPAAIYLRVQLYAKRLGLKALAPHDLRRTFCKLALAGGADIRQVQVSLGHANVIVTERYAGTELDLERPACDFLRLRGAHKDT